MIATLEFVQNGEIKLHSLFFHAYVSCRMIPKQRCSIGFRSLLLRWDLGGSLVNVPLCAHLCVEIALRRKGINQSIIVYIIIITPCATIHIFDLAWFASFPFLIRFLFDPFLGCMLGRGVSRV